jgi:hypothetical protein
VEAIYMDGKTVARIGDVVMTHGQMRGITIAIEGTFVKVLGIGTDMKTGDTFVLPTRYVEHCPASNCHYLEKQTLTL